MGNMLTKRQKEVIDFVKTYQKENGYAPSLEDVRKKFQFASVSTSHFHISHLEDLGLINRSANKPRSIELTNLIAPLPAAARSKAKTKNIESFLNKIICGEAVATLKTMPANSVDLVVT